jgi:hypothetical protein
MRAIRKGVITLMRRQFLCCALMSTESRDELDLNLVDSRRASSARLWGHTEARI